MCTGALLPAKAGLFDGHRATTHWALADMLTSDFPDIDAARRLLEQSDDGLEDVAARCGFSTVETFHRSFRRVVGVTPNASRQRFPGVTVGA